jgi:maltooligosyltrehalose trehalohydrolase
MVAAQALSIPGCSRTLGAILGSDGARFTVWAPEAHKVEVELLFDGRFDRRTLSPGRDGTFSAAFHDIPAGARYRFLVDGAGPFPDPASRFQPEGVHGPSEVIDPGRFVWTDSSWSGLPLDSLVAYELHVGAFTQEGTFRATTAKLRDLADLGITAVELMPLNDFAGGRNWGYDGVALYAPARCYGTPDDLRAFVNEAHRLGIAVLLDVVYNHFGPDGAYHARLSPYYYSAYESPWGRAINLDGPHSAMVRRFFIENALHWICEYHMDGLRLDATHALIDQGDRHFLAEFSATVRQSAPDRQVLLIAEDHRNLAHMLRPEDDRGWGFDAVWADDFHHQVRRRMAGDADGYYSDYTGSTEDIAATLREGWFYRGQYSEYLRHVRGTETTGLTLDRFVIFVQNHDQVGNRAFGDRVHHVISMAEYRAISALLLAAPETPLLFMGQEWAASSPFLFFTDHQAELGRLVSEGRRREFSRFAAFTDPDVRERIPDPQALNSFERSRLVWSEREIEPHASVLRLYEALLALRRREPALRSHPPAPADVFAADEDTIVMRRLADGGAPPFLVIVRLGAGGRVTLAPWHPGGVVRRWIAELSTEDPAYAADSQPIDIRSDPGALSVRFARAGALLLKGVPG